MFRTPLPSAGRSRLEQCSTEDLLGIFESFVRTDTKRIPYNDFPVAWGILFTELYLSAEELVSEIRAGRNLIAREQELLLRDFIRMDCRNGGAFVLSVIKTGGKTDRAALIMFADPADLAGLFYHGTTALHLLAESCDKGVRPALIERAGKKLLSEVFDSRDLPVLFLILGLGDLSRQDLNAIGNVFTRDDLRRVRSRKGTGKSALEAFISVSNALKSHASRDRNAFELTRAVRNTNPGGAIRAQTASRPGTGRVSGAARAPDGKSAESGVSEARSAAERFEELSVSSLDNIGKTMQRKPDSK